MFTGIIEELGVVEALEDQGDAVRLTLRGPEVTADARLGDSISVNGCCLTVAERDGETFTADVMRETLDKTSLNALRVATVGHAKHIASRMPRQKLSLSEVTSSRSAASR